MVRALSIDVGSSSLRTAIVDESGVVTHVHQRPSSREQPPSRARSNSTRPKSSPSLSNWPEPRYLTAGGCDAVGITNQRATTVVFDPGSSSMPVGPALSWQDLRTVFDCLALQGDGIHLAPNQSATKIKWLVDVLDARRARPSFRDTGNLARVAPQ